jgi:two-component system, cell cycle response regulator DivK
MNTVLVVDDDRIMSALLTHWIRELGYAALPAFDVPGALEILASRPVGAVVLDLDLPGANGTEIIRYLKCTPGHQATPIIVVSVHDSTAVIMEVILSGATLFVSKPTDRSRIQQALSTILPLDPIAPRTLALSDDGRSVV